MSVEIYSGERMTGEPVKRASSSRCLLTALIMVMLLLTLAVVAIFIILFVRPEWDASRKQKIDFRPLNERKYASFSSVVSSSVPKPARPPMPPSAYCARTPLDILGPFYKRNTTQKTRFCETVKTQKTLTVHGYILEEGCRQALPNSKIQVWLADPEGVYIDSCYGYTMSDETGYFRFDTSFPGHYYLHEGNSTYLRASHIHYHVTTVQHGTITTQQYFAGDPHTSGRLNGLVTQTRAMNPGRDDGRHIVEFNVILHRGSTDVFPEAEVPENFGS